MGFSPLCFLGSLERKFNKALVGAGLYDASNTLDLSSCFSALSWLTEDYIRGMHWMLLGSHSRLQLKLDNRAGVF